MLQKKKKSGPPPFPPSNWGEPKSGGSFFDDPGNTPATQDLPSKPAWDFANQDAKYATSTFETRFESDFNSQDDRFGQTHHRGLSLSAIPSPKSRGSFGSNHDGFYASDDDLSGANRTRANTYSAPYSPHNRFANTSRGPTMPMPFAQPSPSTGDPFDSELDGQLFDEPSPMLTRPIITPKAELVTPLTPREGVGRAIALFDFNAVEVRNHTLKLQPSAHSPCSPATYLSQRARSLRLLRRPEPRMRGTYRCLFESPPNDLLDCFLGGPERSTVDLEHSPLISLRSFER